VIQLPIQAAPDAIPMHFNCARCTAMCCNYVSTEIDEPTTKKDIDIIRWYLMHAGVRVYCEDLTGSWFVQFMGRCRFLRDDYLCGIYETRPQICRDLSATECEFALGPGDRHLFTNLEEFDRYLQERDRVSRARRARKARTGGGGGRTTARNGKSAPPNGTPANARSRRKRHSRG